MNCFCKKYFDDKELNKLVLSVSLSRREPLYQVLMRCNIATTKDLYYNYQFMRKQNIWIGNSSYQLKESELDLINELCLDFQNRVRLNIKILPYKPEKEIDQYRSIDVILFSDQKDGKKTFINALCTYMKGVKERVTNLGRLQTQSSSLNDLRYEIPQEQIQQQQTIFIGDDRALQTEENPIAIRIHLINKRDQVRQYIQQNKQINISAIFYLSKQDPNGFNQDQQNFVNPVFRLFPIEFRERLYHIITFADFMKFSEIYYPEKYKFLHKNAFQFENQSIFSKEANLINNYHFDLTWKSFERLINRLPRTKYLNSLSDQITNLQQFVDKIKEEQNIMSEQEQILKLSEKSVEENQKAKKKFEQIMGLNLGYQWKEEVWVKTQVQPEAGNNVLNCNSCQQTCCKTCNAKQKQFCTQINAQSLCVNCNCSVETHQFDKFQIVEELKEFTRCDSVKESKYKQAEEQTNLLQTAIDKEMKKQRYAKNRIVEKKKSIEEMQEQISRNSIFQDQQNIRNDQNQMNQS